MRYEVMMNPDYRDAIVQNLKDAGCSAGIIENFLRYFDENQKEKQLELLEIHRNQLLTQIHKEEKKISCLDYLIYQIKK
ncbi:hypothetical protein [Eisenbergiella tayi]|jgi:hypothetical protein|nr:hypothetical protein [Eisenbergiella tayi]MDT4533693.1 hypothetical protein [Eisenbergiella tayi]